MKIRFDPKQQFQLDAVSAALVQSKVPAQARKARLRAHLFKPFLASSVGLAPSWKWQGKKYRYFYLKIVTPLANRM